MIELHRKLLADEGRNAAFYEALKCVIVPGKTVVADIGSGTGFLSFLASKLGAKHCYCYESGDVVELSKKLAKRNGIRNITLSRAHSTSVKKPLLVDVLLSETIGNYALEENILETIEDGKRFLKKGGVIIPGKLRQFVCPVASDRLQSDIDVWGEIGYDLRFDEAREVCLNNLYVKTVNTNDLYEATDAIREWDTIDFSKRNASIRKASEKWTLYREFTIYGFALWWEAELVEKVTLSTSPFKALTHWEQIYLPLLDPIEAEADDVIELSLTSDTRWEVKVNLIWEVVHRRKGKLLSKQKMDMRKGHLD